MNMHTPIGAIPTADLVAELTRRKVLTTIMAHETIRPELLMDGPEFETAVEQSLAASIGYALFQHKFTDKRSQRCAANFDQAPFNRALVEITLAVVVLDPTVI